MARHVDKTVVYLFIEVVYIYYLEELRSIIYRAVGDPLAVVLTSKKTHRECVAARFFIIPVKIIPKTPATHCWKDPALLNGGSLDLFPLY